MWKEIAEATGIPLQCWGLVTQQHSQGTEYLGDGEVIPPNSEIMS